MKKGFTLIELLAVIVILAIIALITAPIISNIIHTMNDNAFVETGQNIISAAKNYQTVAAGNNQPLELTVDYGSNLNTDKLELKGTMPDSGSINIYENGSTEFRLWSDKLQLCIIKTTDSKKITKDKTMPKSHCKL